jgi:predicted AlkP superfamily pyrophosphatase or phosphodiesterase
MRGNNISTAFRVVLFFLFFYNLPHNGKSHENPVFNTDKPDLVVGIVVDKMRYDYITRMWDSFGDNGFKKLINEGTSFNNARYDYLINQSSSGYATIFSGANPSAHGIIADSWYDRLKNENQSSVFDENSVAVGGSFGNGRRSPVRMFTGTVGDELRISNDFRSRVFSISMNDAAAVLSGGFSANTAWWFDDIHGEWMTSTYYVNNLPSWAREFNEARLPVTYMDRKWEPLNEYTAYFSINGDKNQKFEYDLKRLQRRQEGFGNIRSTPFGNTFTRDFAISLIVNEQLGKNGNTDMLILGFSSTAAIGQRYGTFSMELQDAYLRLDQDIAYFLEFLENRFGKSKVLVFLTSDQAVAYPASAANPSTRMAGGTFSPSMALSLLRSYLNVSYGQADWIHSYNAGMVYLNHSLIDANKVPLEDIQRKSSRFLNQVSGIAGTVTEDVMLRNHFSDGILARIQAGFHPKRSGDIMMYLQQGWHERSMAGDQINLISYDQHVPLVFYGWNTERNNFNRMVNITDIAPTLSMMLNIPVPQFSTGRPIMELLK